MRVLADGFSLEFEWQQGSSSLQDSFQYSSRSQQSCSLDNLPSSCYFQVPQSLYQPFGYCTKSTNCNWYNRHLHVPQFFQCPSKVEVLILLFKFFQFYFVVHWNCKVHNSASSCFLLIIIRSGLLVEVRWSAGISKSQRSLCVSFSRIDSGLCIYHLLIWSNFNFLHNFQWITFTFPTQSCLVLYYSCANLLHSLIICLIISSLSPHKLRLLFCCVLSILALIWLVLMVLFCAAIRKDLISL